MGAGCAPCLWYPTGHAGASGSKRRVVGVVRTHDGTFSPILPFRRVRLAATRDCAYAQVRIFARPLAFAQLTGRRLAKIGGRAYARRRILAKEHPGKTACGRYLHSCVRTDAPLRRTGRRRPRSEIQAHGAMQRATSPCAPLARTPSTPPAAPTWASRRRPFRPAGMRPQGIDPS